MQLSVRSCWSPINAILSQHPTLSMVTPLKLSLQPSTWGSILILISTSVFTLMPSQERLTPSEAFFCRNLGHCTRKLKEAAYTIFVRPCVEYASCTWDPHTQRNIRKLKQVQRSCARFVTGDFGQQSSVSAMLKDLNWPTLEERRYSSRFRIPQIRSSVYTMSFFPRTIRDWNNLQKDPAVYSSLDTFKAVLRDPLLM